MIPAKIFYDKEIFYGEFHARQRAAPINNFCLAALRDVTAFLTFFSMGFSGAGQVIIAQLLGAQKTQELGKFIGNMMSFLFTGGIIFSVACLILRENILELLNTPPESFNEALAYWRFIFRASGGNSRIYFQFHE